MLTLKAQILNVFETPEGVNRETGETFGGFYKVQVIGNEVLRNGASRLSMFDLKVPDPAPFEKLVGRHARLPVGIFVPGGKFTMYYMAQDGLEAIE